MVLDVVPSATPGGRRLVVGERATGRVRYAVAVGHTERTNAAVDAEEDTLRELPDRLGEDLRTTVPQVVERVRVDTLLVGLVVTSVYGPGAWRGAEEDHRRPKQLLDVVDAWLAGIWRDTGTPGSEGPRLGQEAVAELLDRYAGPVQLDQLVDSVQRALARLTGFEVPRTLTHGCLCPRHVRSDEDRVTGVDDWGLSAPDSDPLRDLGGFAVRVAGQRLAEVVAGRSRHAGLVRGFVGSGLRRAGLPSALWRHVLVLSQLEHAVRSLERGDQNDIAVLMAAVSALPGRWDEMRRT